MRLLLQGNFRNDRGVRLILTLNPDLPAQGYGAFGDGTGCKGFERLPLDAIIADLYPELTVFLC
jgi:hypothetical protein